MSDASKKREPKKAAPTVPAPTLPADLPPTDTELMFAGKRPGEMTNAELIRCAVHFRDEHVAAMHTIAEQARRMKKLEEGYSKEQVKKLDRWLKVHAQDAERGDGAALYPNWQKWDG